MRLWHMYLYFYTAISDHNNSLCLIVLAPLTPEGVKDVPGQLFRRQSTSQYSLLEGTEVLCGLLRYQSVM